MPICTLLAKVLRKPPRSPSSLVKKRGGFDYIISTYCGAFVAYPCESQIALSSEHNLVRLSLAEMSYVLEQRARMLMVEFCNHLETEKRPFSGTRTIKIQSDPSLNCYACHKRLYLVAIWRNWKPRDCVSYICIATSSSSLVEEDAAEAEIDLRLLLSEEFVVEWNAWPNVAVARIIRNIRRLDINKNRPRRY